MRTTSIPTTHKSFVFTRRTPQKGPESLIRCSYNYLPLYTRTANRQSKTVDNNSLTAVFLLPFPPNSGPASDDKSS